MATGELKHTLTGHTARVKSVVYSPDGELDRHRRQRQDHPHLGHRTGNEKAKLEGHTGDIETLALSPDGKLLASSSNDTTVRLWDMTTLKTVQTLKGTPPKSIRWTSRPTARRWRAGARTRPSSSGTPRPGSCSAR